MVIRLTKQKKLSRAISHELKWRSNDSEIRRLCSDKFQFAMLHKAFVGNFS